MDVHLLVYDLSGGLARQMSMSFLGFQLDAIYHTSIELGGQEYVYDGGINVIRPGSSHLGRPLERIHLGRTDLPMDVINEYLESLREIFTPQAYDLFRHNCNNFSNDFSTFLVGKGIPAHIANMPQAVLDSPFGRMLQPQLTQMVEARKAQQGGLLGIQSNGGPSRVAPVSNGASHAPTPAVRIVSNMKELSEALQQASRSSAVVFFTSVTCPPCKAMYPLYDELAAQWGSKVSLIKTDVSQAMDIGQAYSIRGTPTFVTFLHGKEQERWSGADASRLRDTIPLLAHMAHPKHPHESLNLPSFAGNSSVKPQLYTKIPPLSKLLGKLGARAEDPAIQGVKHFIDARAAEGPAEATLPDMPAFSKFMQSAPTDLPRDLLFTVVDLFRCALVDPRFSGYFAEEAEHATVLAILNTVNDTSSAECPYALRLVALQMACNLFSSHLYASQIMQHAKLRGALTQLVSTSFLDDGHNNVRVASASLLFNIAVAANQHVREGGAPTGLPDDDQVELAASVLEAIGQEESSKEALHGMLLALGYLVYCMPVEGELVDLLRAMDAQGTVTAKKKLFPEEKLVQEVGSELLGKGLARK
ncbi:thioredoxin [Microdochium trichocladiopsis]|uniref:Thioredoxin n=1 Tax=Microdochium trichocladiopsis TaxID=1682393 RepID=A0A9P8YBN3_9PEZI|nr:thioredoxin [Microdochium trichocladiopsis]KAH7033232.1 thioredoxin [Microdochium trichocladiopsis]